MNRSAKEKSSLMLAHQEALDVAGMGLDSLSYNDNNTESSPCQSALAWSDTESEIQSKFTPKKRNSVELANSYSRIGWDNRSDRVRECGTRLEFAHEISPEGVVSDVGKLHSANFCKDRLCPMCAWRRTYKIFAQVSQIMGVIGDKYKFLFLTLTVPNVTAQELPTAVDELMKAWRKLMRYKRVSAVVRGFFRALEITRNKDPRSKSFGTYHPHFHAVLAVPKNYGKGKEYINHDEWLTLWRKATKDPTITQVDIRLARNKHDDSGADSDVERLASVVAEIAKYPVKDADILVPGDHDQTDSIVETLANALAGRRLTAYGGCFDDAWNELKLDDAEDGDLIHLKEKLNPAMAWLVVKYGWSCGVYKISGSYVKQPKDMEDET